MQIKNYTLLEEKWIEELHATGYVFRHDATGAHAFYLYTPDDDNQVFSIAFATPPENDCGLPHILEHCTLNGSRKYPVKEPFVELLKGSLNTFLNAMTFNDKTMYPVASRNEKDFMNLVDVYLDAVFYPNLRHNPYIFRQEGWHYELDSKDAEITYKGVVYNEMKGDFSSPDSSLVYLIQRNLYPESNYGKESGGYPEAIPNLSYEEFCAFHARYYHPCNSFIFFYGNGDIEKHLAYVDEEYLQAFANVESKPAVIKTQPRREEIKEVCETYAIGEGEDKTNKTFFSYNVMLDQPKNATEYYALGMLGDILCEGEASPVKIALLEAGIGQDISCDIMTSIMQPALSIVAKNANSDQKDAFLRVVRETLEKAVKEGLDPKLVEATIASTEFQLREGNFGSAPKGLIYGINCMDSWLYGGSPLTYLSFEEPMKEIRSNPHIFEELIQKCILDNQHGVIATLEPEEGLNAKIEAATREKLAAYKASLSEEEIETLVAETAEIKRRQMEPDDPENLRKLPLLQMEDLEEVKPFKPAEEIEIAGRKAAVYRDFTSHIVYLSLNFDMDHLPEQYIPYAGLLAEAMGMMDTASHEYTDLDNEIGCHMGGLNFNVRFVQRLDGSFKPYYYANGKFLTAETENAMKLFKETLLTTNLDDKDRLQEILEESLISLQDGIGYSGDQTASARCYSYFDPMYAYREKTTGVDYFLFLKDLVAHFDERAEETIRMMKETAQILIREGNLRARMTLDPEDETVVTAAIAKLTGELPQGISEKASEEIIRVKPVMKNEALITSGKVQYVCRAGRTSVPYNGAIPVLSQILSLDYLWNNVRVMGGAYGCRRGMDRLGRVRMASYRDPNLAETIEIFNKAGEWASSFDADEREMTKYIIGTMAGLDPVQTVSMKGAAACEAIESGTECDYLTRISREVLKVKPEDVRAAAAVLTEAMSEPFVCCVGSETKIKENADRFDNLVRLF